MNKQIAYKRLHLKGLEGEVLKDFKRYQETNRVWFKDAMEYKVKNDYFVEEWDKDKKLQVLHSLRQCIKNGGFVVGGFVENRLIGFANVEGEFFGRTKKYLELSFLHVSNEFRNLGIGKKLFELCCIESKEKGANKLYIAAHPSVETQGFYLSIGCTYAVEINQVILEKEPLDIQMEFDVDSWEGDVRSDS